MGLFDRFKKRTVEEQEAVLPDLSPYSDLAVEVSSMDGQLLFMARLTILLRGRAELRQLSPSSLGEDVESLPVRIRGYQKSADQAVCLEGAISPQPVRYVWAVENLRLMQVGNDRAFFRLNTNVNARVVPSEGPEAGEEKPCRLLNISVGGARIRSDFAWQEGDKFTLKVQLLEDREISDLSCRILRVVKNTPPYEYGCQFLNLSEADQDRITENIFAAQRRKRSGR